MVALFGPSEPDLERMRSTVESLGSTSVPGLSAALAWRQRKTEKLLAHELARPNTPLLYDPSRRMVRWNRPPPAAPARPDSATAPAAPPPSLRVAPRAPAPVLAGTTLKVLCPSCRVALIPTGSPSLAVCPQCGRLSSARTPTGEAPATPAPSPSPPGRAPTAASAAGAATTSTDRRSQEMFAAYVTSKPIPCPKCRTPLRHRGVSEYVCPACAQTVQFPMGPAAAAPAAPAGPA